MKEKYYGVDASKDTLDIACEGKVVQIENNAAAIRSFVKSMPEGSYVGVEATNSYHLGVADICFGAGMRMFVVNPRVTRHYREVRSLRGHTDRMDAQTLALFIEREHSQLRPYLPKTPEQRRLETLIRRRSKLVGVKTQVRQSLQGVKEVGGELEAALT
jgi:transposase